jgi:hypothetical protein
MMNEFSYRCLDASPIERKDETDAHNVKSDLQYIILFQERRTSIGGCRIEYLKYGAFDRRYNINTAPEFT